MDVTIRFGIVVIALVGNWREADTAVLRSDVSVARLFEACHSWSRIAENKSIVCTPTCATHY
jgi:hypothetical protein